MNWNWKDVLWKIAKAVIAVIAGALGGSLV